MLVSDLKDIEWSDLRLFIAVARNGGLGPAARVSSVSAPTLGRRVAVLERQLGMRLFLKSREGYTLTEGGRRLLGHAQEVEAAVAGITRWRSETAGPLAVRISAGHWMTRFLARHIGAIRLDGDDWTLDFVTAHARLDIGRREADIGIRNRRPDERSLAGRRVATVAFAAYATRDSDGAALPWIGLAGDAAVTPSAQWLAREADAPIAYRCTDPGTLLDLARGGVGRAVLPCLVGDADPQLVRAGGLITPLTSEQWLVTHHDDRHDASIHATAGRIAKLIGSSKRLFAGDEPN
ncbi:LysR family transcriptional regulator [Mesorhizobium sp. BR1-1-16]|uniref:LysR family transcriptional regulator n=1 Tax=Mesorhizobium sp. BR1-1-16 TaxID=2876653 RepID=UPI001CCAD22E|nr:LysR family transcriptional regulator [Mesorhizobium sp. BR1-1-16]MBZ9939331.1 LysR family transcriptional regulator [Mesorhizobium sp. BR1-1-16]